MIQRKATVYRLYPNAKQRIALARIVGSCRVVYNLALEQRRDWWRRYKDRTGRSISYEDQCKELTALRKDVDWLREAPIHPLQQALNDLNEAYKRFFLGISGYPTVRKKGVHNSFRFSDPATFRIEHTDIEHTDKKKGGEKKDRKKKGRIKLPKLGWMKFRGGCEIPGEIRNVTISLRAGQWFASVQWKREVPDPVPSTLHLSGLTLVCLSLPL